jgi:hypothetical protein
VAALLPPGPIADYCADVARNLRFDPDLARRVRAEIEDHLLEALDNHGDAACVDAQHAAIRAFGDARQIARDFAAGALQSLARRTAVLTALAVIAVFVAMDARVAWNMWVAQPLVGEQTRAAAAIGIPIDRTAFALAFVAALAALALMMARRAPLRVDAAFGLRITRCIRLAVTAVLALLAAVATELVLAAIHLSEAKAASPALVPTLTLLVECAAAVSVTAHLAAAARRLSLALRLSEVP